MSPSRRKAMPTDRLTLAVLPMPAKILATSVLVTLAIGLLGALGQIVISRSDRLGAFPGIERGRFGIARIIQIYPAAQIDRGKRGNTFQ